MTLWMKLILYAAIAAAVVGAVAWFASDQRDTGRAEIQSLWDKDKARQANEALQDSVNNARETQRRLDRQKANDDKQIAELQAARADGELAGRAAVKLRNRTTDLADTAKRSCGNTATDEQRKAGTEAVDLLAYVQRSIDERAGALAEFADRAYIRGGRCEADYDALTVPGLIKP